MSGSESDIDDQSRISDLSSAKSSESSAKLTPTKAPSQTTSQASTTAEVTEPQVEQKYEDQQVAFVYKGDIEKRQEVTLPVNTSVKALKAELAKAFQVQERNIKLFINGRKLHKREVLKGRPTYKVRNEQMSVSVVNASAGGQEIVIETGLDESESEDEQDKKPVKLDPAESLSSSNINVIPSRGFKNMEVAVVKTLDSREYFGGYKNKKTGTIYYHATSQTDYKNARLFSSGKPTVKLYTRETQTLLPLIDEGINTTSEKCTQMAQKEVYIPEVTDKIVTARPYQPFNEKNKRMTPEAAVRILQKAWKFFIKKKKLHDSYQAEADERMARKQFKGSSMAEFHKQQLSLLTKDSFPTTRSDFYDLYTKLGEWKLAQARKLKELKSGYAYKVAVADLQKKETEGLLAIEEQRVRAKNENLRRQDIMFLEGTARSRVRQYPKGNVTIIDDLNILKAREFKEQFASYMREDVTKPERIEILSCMKSFLAGFEAVDLTADLIELLDREVDMITIGIEEKHLAILRKRFESLYINLAKNPEFNPQAKYYRGSSMTKKKYAMYRCVRCRKVIYPSQMFMHLRMGHFRTCMSCTYMHTTATATTNLAPYKRLLNSLRAAEQEKCCRSAIPFLLQPMGMYFLVNVLWDGKSVISGSSYLPGLKVTRWLPNDEWSMWNMILLTELEAHKHERLENPLQHYSKEFVLNVVNRNILGRMHFDMVADIDAKFRDREPKGKLPKDHLLLTNRRAEGFLPKNHTHPCLVPSSVTYGGRSQAKKRDACN